MNNTNKIPYGYCFCGCGQKTKISPINNPKNGWVKGEPRKFLIGHQSKLRVTKDLSGQVFGRWLVISFSHKNKYRSSYWNCRCECGNERTLQDGQLKNGTNQSCGCLQKELAAEKKYKHGLSRHPLRPTYQAMKSRCYSINCPEYNNYGGRGITVCDRWIDSFRNFLDDMGERPENHSLDRINNDGPYSPENCRWATGAEQSSNRRITCRIAWDDRIQTLGEWAKETGISARTIYSRLRYGWTIEQVFATPIDKKRHKRSQV